nr:pentatricopeptide repeat-containing protein [Tanacetum cinerariifolium]
MKRWEELIRENVFGQGGYHDHLSACLAHMLYCIVFEQQYNLAYFFSKRIESARATSTANPPYACHVAAALMCTRLQVAADDWYEVEEVAGRLANRSVTCVQGDEIVQVVEA